MQFYRFSVYNIVCKLEFKRLKNIGTFSTVLKDVHIKNSNFKTFDGVLFILLIKRKE